MASGAGGDGTRMIGDRDDRSGRRPTDFN